ncbi:MAG: HEPN domain-containing protein [Gemmatimonadaceae bacterium]
MTDAAIAADPRLGRIVERILDHVRPELILLFGSRAWGVPRDDSDYDLMLVTRDSEMADRFRKNPYEWLRSEGCSVDVRACTVDEYERRQHDPGLIHYKIAREGHVLYTTGLVRQHSAPSRRVREQPPGEGLELWIRKAEGDFQAAETLMGAEPRQWDVITFLSHQYVEKALKALITSEGNHPPKTHALTELLARLDNEIRDNRGVADACTMLTNVYARARYPDAGPSLSAEEGHDALDVARRIRDLLWPVLEHARGNR